MSKETYYSKHNSCPKCGNSTFISTYIGYIWSNINDYKVECNSCGWTGITHDLVEKSEKL